MLSSLLQTLKPSQASRQANTNADCIAEDSHTFGLLFPDGNGPRRYGLDGHNDSLNSPRSTANYGEWPLYNDVDLAFPRDIRILIAQAGTSFANAELIFDSKPSKSSDSVDTGGQRHLRSPTKNDQASKHTAGAGRGRASGTTAPLTSENAARHHRRTSSAFSTSGAFERRARRTSLSSAHGSIDAGADHNRGKDDIERLALSCMFENASSSYKGTSSKVHVVPLATKPYESSFMSQSLGSDVSSSYMKPHLVRKPSTLSKSHMPDDFALPHLTTDFSRAPSNSSQDLTAASRRIVLVTRTFSISWTDDDTDTYSGLFREASVDHIINRLTGFSEDISHRRARTFRSPMYAVTIVLRLPVQSRDTSPSASRAGTFGKASLRKDSSSRSPMIVGSFESDRRPHWTGAGSFSGLDAMTSSLLGTDVDDRVDLIGQHWDIISRTLATLQALTQKKVLDYLKPLAKTSRSIRVPAHVFEGDETVCRIAEECGLRVLRGMRLPRARTGHGDWAAWRDEARWLASWSSQRTEGLFLLILLTAYLGTHTDWIQTLAPRSYRRKFRDQQRSQDSSKMSLPSRTIIISSDKMAARRLVFLLAAFLPATQANRRERMPPLPALSSSLRAYSQSPPPQFPLSRQHSLRRTISKPAKTNPGIDVESQGSSITAISDVLDDRTEIGTIQPSEGDERIRRASDAQSVLRKLALLDIGPAVQKSSAIASPTTPDAALVKPHFARQASYGAEPLSAHSRSSSAASSNLLAPRKRINSTESQSRPWNPFGKLFGQQRESDPHYLDVRQTTDEGLSDRSLRPLATLQQMVEDAHRINSHQKLPVSRKGDTAEITDDSPEGSTAVDVAQPIDVPLKMSVNRDDGVIDVEIPFGEFGSPAILSPTLPGDHSGSSYGDSSFGQTSILIAGSKEPAQPLNVSGWLDKIHPDFTLQAIKPYADMFRDIKAAMSAEPTPTPKETLAERVDCFELWVDICTSLVADTNKFTVTRLHLRRRVRFVRNSTTTNPIGPFQTRSYSNSQQRESAWGNSAASTSGLTDYTLEEKFEEKVLASIDREFADVVEQVIGMSADASNVQSNASSRSSSRRGRTVNIIADLGEADADHKRDFQRLITDRLESIISSEILQKTRQAQRQTDTSAVDAKTVLDGENCLRTGVGRWLDELDKKGDNHYGIDQSKDISDLTNKSRAEYSLGSIRVQEETTSTADYAKSGQPSASSDTLNH